MQLFEASGGEKGKVVMGASVLQELGELRSFSGRFKRGGCMGSSFVYVRRGWSWGQVFWRDWEKFEASVGGLKRGGCMGASFCICGWGERSLPKGGKTVTSKRGEARGGFLKGGRLRGLGALGGGRLRGFEVSVGG